MDISKSILIALFVMAVVFIVLGVLWAIIRLLSFIIIILEKRTSANNLKK